MRKISLLITDIDNTLYDWIHFWHSSFSAMLDELARSSRVPRDRLIADFKCVHQTHGTAEYAFSIEELECLNEAFPGADLVARFMPAIEAYRTAREASLSLYPGVLDTLQHLRRARTLVVGYTESMEFYTRFRLKHLGLDGLLDFVYTPEDHQLPKGMTREQARRYGPQHYRYQQTVQRHTPRGVLKPSPEVLLDIIVELNGDRDSTLYVGDSKMKDIAMAKAAGVTDAWAKYGVSQAGEKYELLKLVTHWSDAEVKREQELLENAPKELDATVELAESFAELLDYFEFVPFGGETAYDRQTEATAPQSR